MIVDHTSDVMIEGKGRTFEKALEGIAIALQNVMIDISSIKPRKVITDHVEVASNSYENVLFEFLSKLVFIKDVKKFAYNDINVSILNDNITVKIHFTLKGEKIDINRHKIFTDVKGVSYCELRVIKEKDYYICRCVVDV